VKIGRDTKQRIIAIKAESQEVKTSLERLLIRLEEHAGTKRIARQLEAVIDRLTTWQQTPHV
jgi:hypothetical protein